MAIELFERRISAGWISVSKLQLAGIVTLLVYVIGTSGLIFGDFNFFVRSTPFILVLNFVLVVWTESNRNLKFLIFLFASFLFSMLFEVIGIQTGAVFGRYAYSNLLGTKILKVPLLIGVNWLVLIYGAGNLMNWLSGKFRIKFSLMVSVAGGALVTTFFDWIMEPAAARLGYWHWQDQTDVPLSNFISWFLVSAALMLLFKRLCNGKVNYFAIFLLAIQVVFFLALRFFLP